MTREEYKSLIRDRFISTFRGSINRSNYEFKSREDFLEVYKKVEPIMLKQLTDDFDINNCIIIIPVNTGYGTNYLWNNKQIVDSHLTHSVTLRYKLHRDIVDIVCTNFTNKQSRRIVNYLYSIGQIKGSEWTNNDGYTFSY